MLPFPTSVRSVTRDSVSVFSNFSLRAILDPSAHRPRLIEGTVRFPAGWRSARRIVCATRTIESSRSVRSREFPVDQPRGALRASTLAASPFPLVRDVGESLGNKSVAIRHLNSRQCLGIHDVAFLNDFALGEYECGKRVNLVRAKRTSLT
jgi:hypothetical protein